MQLDNPITYKNHFFKIQSIAIIGASDKPGLGRIVFSQIIKNFNGGIYPINSNYEYIMNHKCYKNLLDIPEKIDLAVIITFNKNLTDLIDEIRKKSIKNIILVPLFFKVQTQKKQERELISISKKYNIQVLDLAFLREIYFNQNSIINSNHIRLRKKGNIALISQSDRICSILLTENINIGFSRIFYIKNKVNLDESELLELLIDDPKTKVIMMYLENINNIQRFKEVTKIITKEKNKPIFILKTNNARSEDTIINQNLIKNYDKFCEELFNDCGIIQVHNFQDLLNLSLVFSSQPFPNSGSKIAIISNIRELAILSYEIYLKLKLERNVNNQINIVEYIDINSFVKIVLEILKDPQFGSIIVICGPSLSIKYIELAKQLVNLSQLTNKTILSSFFGISKIDQVKKIFTKAKIPFFHYPESAISSLKFMYEFQEWRNNLTLDSVYQLIDWLER